MQKNSDKITNMEDSSTEYHQNKKMDEEATNCSTIKSSLYANSSQKRQMGQEVNIKFQINNVANDIDNIQNERLSSQPLNQMLRRQQMFRQQQIFRHQQMSRRQQMFHRKFQEEFAEDGPQQREQNYSGQILLHINFKQFDVDCSVSSNATIRQVKSFIRYKMLQHYLLPDISNILLMYRTENGLIKYLIGQQEKIGSIGNGKEIQVIVSQIGIRSIINLEF